MWHLRKNIAKQCCNNFQKGKKCRKTPSVSTLGSSVRLCREMVERVSTAVIPATLVDWETEFTVDHDAFCLTANSPCQTDVTCQQNQYIWRVLHNPPHPHHHHNLQSLMSLSIISSDRSSLRDYVPLYIEGHIFAHSIEAIDVTRVNKFKM